MNTISNVAADRIPGTIDALLLHSLRLYTSLLDHYNKLQSTISTTTEQTGHNSSEPLAKLFLEIQKIEKDIETRLKNTSVTPNSTQELLGKRAALLDTLVKKNQTITNQAESIKSLLRHEISGMSTNRRAIQGYMPVASERNIVKNSY